VRLRVKDVDFGYARITVRGWQRSKRLGDDGTAKTGCLAQASPGRSCEHEEDLEEGAGDVYLREALARNIPGRQCRCTLSGLSGCEQGSVRTERRAS